MPGRDTTFKTGYRYGFNGKEMDNEPYGGQGNEYDYGFRVYNPRIGRFLSVDPLTKSYPWYSPFQFAGNSPIKNLDLDGREEIPNEIWNAVKSYGRNLIRQVTYYAINKTIQSVGNYAANKTEEQLDDKINSGDTKQAMVGVTGEFVLGLGPESRSFGPEHPLTKSLAQSHLAQAAEEKFIELNKDALAKGDLKNVKDFKGLISFGITGLFDNSGALIEDMDNAAQMVGSATFTVSLSKDGKTIYFHVYDTKNRWSLFYHGKIPGTKDLAKSKSRNQTLFMGTTEQTYDWSKNFDISKYKKKH